MYDGQRHIMAMIVITVMKLVLQQGFHFHLSIVLCVPSQVTLETNQLIIIMTIMTI